MKKTRLDNKAAPKTSREFLFGIHPVIEALKAAKRKVFALYLSDPDNPRFTEIISLAEKRGISPSVCTKERLASINPGAVHQGVFLEVSSFVYHSLDKLLDNPPSLIVLADGIEDPGNLGAIARTALCLGAGAILIPKDRSAKPTPAAVKASAGALEHLLLCELVNVVRFLEEIKKKDFWVAGLDVTGKPISSIDKRGNFLLLVGGEDRGIRPLVARHCDYLLSIPQSGPLGSLNASVAAALAIYEFRRDFL